MNKPIAYYDTQEDSLLKWDKESRKWKYDYYTNLEAVSPQKIKTEKVSDGDSEQNRFLPIYPREVQETLSMEFTDEHLAVIGRALEAYSRFKIGQFGTAFESVFPQNSLDLDDKNLIDMFLRKFFFFEDKHLKNPNASLGIYNEKAEDGTLAYNISKIIEEYQSVKNNGGYWGYHRGFDGPLYKDNLPKTNFDCAIYYSIDDPELNKKAWEHFNKQEYNHIWEILDEQFPWVHRGGAEITWVPRATDLKYPEIGWISLKVSNPKMKLIKNS